jgi:hypothetical protein
MWISGCTPKGNGKRLGIEWGWSPAFRSEGFSGRIEHESSR